MNLPLMPWPAHVVQSDGQLVIDNNFSAGLSGTGRTDPRVRDATLQALHHLFRQTGIPVRQEIVKTAITPTLEIRVEHQMQGIQKLGDDESYHLVITSHDAKLAAREPLGAIRGLQTFLQLVHIGPAGFAAPAVDITDEPRFGWRGLSLDVSRHFLPVADVKRTLDGLAAVKLNVLHWHLSDDQGFRVESKRYPRLQTMGSDGLYYTQAEVRDVIAYARNRGVRIVPEFDIPGHTTAWFVGYPQLATGKGPYEIVREPGILTATMDPTRESTYTFLDGFIGEMAQLFPDEYFHIGGDEVNPKGEWATSPRIAAFMKQHNMADLNALQAYFTRRVQRIVAKHGKRMEGWDEILHPDLPKSIVIQSWRGQKSLADAAQQGYSGLLSAGYYLDLMEPASKHYQADPLIGPTADLTSEQKKRILGGEAAMWEELATTENIDAKLWPRLAAIAERLWSPQEVTDIPSMYRRLAQTSEWLQFQGMEHRSQLRLMQTRLAGDFPVEPLSMLASVLEPIGGYSRHEGGKYSSLSSYNRLVDSIAPESDSAREFRNAVDRYTAAPSNNTGDAASIRDRLSEWQRNVSRVMPILKSNALLTEDIDVANALNDLCSIGLDAMDRITSGSLLDAAAVRTKNSTIDDAAKPKAEMTIAFAPGIRKLVEASAKK
jgi:hexosaminidase